VRGGGAQQECEAPPPNPNQCSTLRPVARSASILNFATAASRRTAVRAGVAKARMKKPRRLGRALSYQLASRSASAIE
jgi:hypothetical protein